MIFTVIVLHGTGWAKKIALFSSIDNLVTVNGRKASYTSNFPNFV